MKQRHVVLATRNEVACQKSPNGDEFYREASIELCKIFLIEETGKPEKNRASGLLRECLRLIAGRAPIDKICEVLATLLRMLRE